VETATALQIYMLLSATFCPDKALISERTEHCFGEVVEQGK
jgi:hypothetical protein